MNDVVIADTLVVVNPASAGGRTRRQWSETAARLLGAAIDFVAYVTTAPGDATHAVRDALQDGCTRVIAVGGDGTLNEVVCGFFNPEGHPINAAATLAILPSGTGGDFRKTAGIPANTADAVGIIASGQEWPIDVGRVEFADGTMRHFINIADAGLGGEVVSRVNRSSNKSGGMRGTAVFLAASLATLATFGSRRVRVTMDGAASEHEVQSLVVANGRYFGGGMHIAPGAVLDDGFFDVVLIEARGFAQSLRGLPGLYRGAHLAQPGVRVQRAREVRVESLEQPLLFDIEGEQIGRTPANLTLLPQAIRLCAPPVRDGR